MKLKGRKIGVAITGSFCTYEKSVSGTAGIKKRKRQSCRPFFSDAAQSIDSRLEMQRICDKARKSQGRADADNPPGGAIGPKGLLDLLILNAVYGKQHCEAGQWDYGHSCADGCKSASAQ